MTNSLQPWLYYELMQQSSYLELSRVYIKDCQIDMQKNTTTKTELSPGPNTSIRFQNQFRLGKVPNSALSDNIWLSMHSSTACWQHG